MTAGILKEDPNTKKNAIYYDKTQHEHFGVSPFFLRYKQHLNNS